MPRKKRKRCVLQSKQTSKNKQTHRHTKDKPESSNIYEEGEWDWGRVDTGGCILYIWKIKSKL